MYLRLPQGGVIFWLQFWGALMSSLFLYSWCDTHKASQYRFLVVYRRWCTCGTATAWSANGQSWLKEWCRRWKRQSAPCWRNLVIQLGPLTRNNDPRQKAAVWICPCILLQKMNIQWMTDVWSTCWRVCVWRTRAASRTLRNASKKCFPGEFQWIHFKCGQAIINHFLKAFLSANREVSVRVGTWIQLLATWLKTHKCKLESRARRLNSNCSWLFTK